MITPLLDIMMICSRIIFLGVFLYLGSSNARVLQTRILGGKGVNIENFPYQVDLRSLKFPFIESTHYCGGSIISEKHILTAAHCINSYRLLSLSVHTGTGYTNVNGTIHTVEQLGPIDVHPEWEAMNPSYKNDIAIITLKEPIVFDKYQQNINLPSENVKPGSKAIVTGWGLTSQNPNAEPEQLQMLETEIISNEECRELTDRIIDETQVCALRGKGAGACSGDSGGPLVVDGKIVGIVSWVKDSKCGVGIPEVYTNVYAYKDFIQSILNK